MVHIKQEVINVPGFKLTVTGKGANKGLATAQINKKLAKFKGK